jgi:predicted RecB family nuclease
VKTDIAHEIGDISQIWQCGPKHRIRLLEQGITSFHDDRCTSEVMGFSKERGRIIDCILNIQRSEDIIRIHGGKLNIEKVPSEFYIDFEIIPDALCDTFESEYCNREPHLFMIGIGWEVAGEWLYRAFVARDGKRSSVSLIVRDLIDFLPDNSTLYHWNHTEKTHFNRICETHHIAVPKNITWIDLLPIIQNAPVVLKGCYNFKLKSIATQMKHYGLIQSEWAEDMKSGLDCAVDAYNIYKEGLGMPEEMLLMNFHIFVL